MTTHHFSDPHTAAIFAAIRASNAGITRAELQAEFPDKEDHPGQLGECIKDLKTKGAVVLVGGRYLAAGPTPADGPASNLFPGLGAVPPSAPPSKQEQKTMKRATEQLGVREAVRQAVAAGKRDRDEVATATGITMKQATDALCQLAKLGELSITRAGRRGEPAQYAVATGAAAVAPKKRGRPAGGGKVEKIAKLVDSKLGTAKRTKGAKAAKTPRGPYKKRGTKPSTARSTAVVVPQPAQIETHLVAMQPDGAVIVIDQAANTIETIAPDVVQQILRFAPMRLAA